MPRLLSTALVLALLAGTAAAFAVTEGLKLQRSPITKPRIDKRFSPTAERGGGRADIAFRLRKGDRITVAIVDADGNAVRTLLEDVRRDRGDVHVTWDGRSDAGRLVAQGRYRPRVHLANQRRTIVLPNPIEVDVTAPRISIVSVRPRVFSPDRDGRRDFVRLRYRVDEPARALLLVDGVQTGRGRLDAAAGKLNWFGTARGDRLPPGIHTLALRGEDRAGNLSPRRAAVRVRIRYVELERDVMRAAPRGRLRLRVSTDAARVRWILGGRRGIARGSVLRLHAPRRPGRYTLYVSANRHADRATVVVRRREST
ncbi:MAG: hypothetical protein M3322_06730 [Actinomycetota bacterium]|nr:hypothetical protein [Actinomycetota bacterium]